MKECPSCGYKNANKAKFCIECAARFDAEEDLFLGTTIENRYKILSKIAEGGMGTVYRAKHLRIDKDIALKILHPELTHDKKVIKRFENEAKVIASLDHENIVRVQDTGPIRETYFIAMDHVEGEDLIDMIGRRVQIPIEEAFSIASQVADGLAYAHERDILHRDIKPANIIVKKSGKAVITDFGIAKAIGDKGQTTTGTSIGTPEYMSLEQVKGKKLDGRTDVYSLGVVLYEMLSGKSPFRSDSGVSALAKVLSEKPEPIERLVPEIPGWAMEVVNKAMAKDKDERYGSAAEFLDAIKEGMGEGPPPVPVAGAPKEKTKKDKGKGVEPKATAAATPLKSPEKKRKALIISLVSLIVLGIAVIAILLSGVPITKADRAAYYRSKGDKALKSKSYNAAVEYYTKAINLDPKNPYTYYMRGDTYASMDKNDLAILDYERACDGGSKKGCEKYNELQFEVYKDQGKKYLQSKNYSKAVEFYTKAIKIKDDDSYVFYYRGEAYSHQDKYDYALRDFEKACKLGHYSACDKKTEAQVKVYENKGDEYYKSSNYDSAVEYYTMAIRIAKDSSSLYDKRGKAYEYAKKVDYAISDYRTACNKGYSSGCSHLKSLKNSHANEWFSKGDKYYKKKSWKSAIECYKKGLTYGEGNKYVYFHIGYAYGERGYYNDSISYYKKAIRIDSKYKEAYNNIGWCYGKLGKRSSAKSYFRKACNLGNKTACKNLRNYE